MEYTRILLIGNGRVADDCLRIMAKKGIAVEYIEIFAEKFAFTEKLCQRLGVSFRHLGKSEIEEFLIGIQDETLIISAHNSYIFPNDVCEKSNLTIINLHIAYLPQYRGMNPSTWAIFNRERYAGATWHIVSNKIDNGEIIIQRKVCIDEDDTAMKLMLRCFNEGVRLFEENFDAIINRTYTTFTPKNVDSHLYLSKELPNDGYVDLSWNADKIYAFLRAMDYSGSDLMRLPRMKKNGKTYEIIKYYKEVDGNLMKEKEMDSYENVRLSGGGYALLCVLREMKNN